MDNTQKNNKFLPISEPMITTYTQHAHLLTIIGNYKFTYPWIFSNYIQLYINKDYIKHSWSDFYFPFPYELRPSDTCKWITSQKIQRDVVFNKWGTFLNLIIDCINSDTYIHAMIDNYYIPFKENYLIRHFLHDILIVGYDLNKKVVFGYEFSEQGRYCCKEISFNNITKAFQVYDTENNPDYLNKTIYLYRINEDSDYMFDIRNIINSIKAYLYAKVPEYWEMYNNENRDEVVFGVDIYGVLKDYSIRNSQMESSYIDIRPYYLLYDHKKLMAIRIKYLLENNYLLKINETILDRFSKLEEKTRRIIYLLLKYNETKQIGIINRITIFLREIEIEEKEALTNLIDLLN